MTFDEILDKAVIGAQRTSKLPYARLLVIAEAAFSQVNNELSRSFAANEDKRSLLRFDLPLTFAAGTVAMPSSVLTDYLKDATLVLSTGDTASLIEPYADYLRVRDNRLAWWSFNDELISAKNSATNGGDAYDGAATLTCITSPAIPATASTTFAGKDDYTSELISSLTKYLLGKTEKDAVE